MGDIHADMQFIRRIGRYGQFNGRGGIKCIRGDTGHRAAVGKGHEVFAGYSEEVFCGKDVPFFVFQGNRDVIRRFLAAMACGDDFDRPGAGIFQGETNRAGAAPGKFTWYQAQPQPAVFDVQAAESADMNGFIGRLRDCQHHLGIRSIRQVGIAADGYRHGFVFTGLKGKRGGYMGLFI